MKAAGNRVDDRYHHGDLRAALLRSALALLAEEGGPALSLRAVAAHAGASSTAPYRHFADREALLAALATLGFDRLSIRLTRTLSGPGVIDEVAALGRAYLAFAQKHRALYRLMFTDAELAVRRDEILARSSEAAFLSLRDAVARRVGADDPAEVQLHATAIWAALHGAAMLSFDGRLMHKASGRKRGDFAVEVAEVLMRGVIASATAAGSV